MAHKLAPQAYAAKIKIMVFSMNEDECNVLHEKQNVINKK